MYKAKKIKEILGLDMSTVSVSLLLDESDVIFNDNNTNYYGESALKKVSERLESYELIKKNIDKIYNYYGRPLTQGDPEKYIRIGIVFYLNNCGYKRSEIAFLIDKSYNSTFKMLEKEEEYRNDRIGDIIINDVMNKCREWINV